MTFPLSREQTPRPNVPGLGLTDKTLVKADYREGSDVGYRWFARRELKPLFPFGYGLSYAAYAHGPLRVTAGSKISASFTVRHVDGRAGADVPQLYLLSANGDKRVRLLGFEKVALKPGESRKVTITVDPRLMANWRDGQWVIDGGRYRFAVGKSAEDLGAPVEVDVPRRAFR